MKLSAATLATATLAMTMSVQAQTISAKWCELYKQSCLQVSRQLCGGSFTWTQRCYASFTNNACMEYSVDCHCVADGSTEEKRSLPDVWTVVGANTAGACNNAKNLPVPPSKDGETAPSPTMTTATAAPTTTAGAGAGTGTGATNPPSATGSPEVIKKPVNKASTSLHAVTGSTVALLASIVVAAAFY